MESEFQRRIREQQEANRRIRLQDENARKLMREQQRFIEAQDRKRACAEQQLAQEQERAQIRREKRGAKRARGRSGGGMGLFRWLLILALVAFVAYYAGKGVSDQPAGADDLPEATVGEAAEYVVPSAVPDSADVVQSVRQPLSKERPVEDTISESAISPERQAQDDAANSAFASGETVRWETEGGQGYAVPSEEAAGCRNVTITIDHKPEATRVAKVCG